MLDSKQVDDFISDQQSVNTQRAYRYDLGKWSQWMADNKVETPTKRNVLDFKEYLERNVSPRTGARIFNTCRVFYRWIGAENPFQGLKSPRRLRNAVPMVPEDTLIDNIVASCDDIRDSAVISLLLNGLRSEEVTNLTPDDFFWSEEYDNYIIRVVGKGLKQRFVPATTEATENVIRMLDEGENDTMWLLPSRDGRRMTTRQVRYVTEKHSIKCGKVVRPHKMRHHYATRLIRADASVFAVKELLGHESVETTQVYVGLDMRDIMKAAGKDPRNRRNK